MSTASAPADRPVTDLSTLPLILLIDDVARVYRRGVPTIRRDLQAGTFRPEPFEKFPYRWLRETVEDDLRRRSRAQKKPTDKKPAAKSRQAARRGRR